MIDISAGANIRIMPGVSEQNLQILKVDGDYAYYRRNYTKTHYKWIDGEERPERRTHTKDGMIRVDVLEKMANDVRKSV